ncbi:carbohydrate ABC transporter substrate-binding protein [Nordella sp. HKS 07]|uniref:ABC transporter substrate-binding protein n=1 Tax=Nordella sp. HKS 07 TaxID=2712222 RepID=UPI0013E1232C|nr:ABC transporter substrate-binding protein [Nordella sp. HKS 07]QIG46503.1 carbohydrate ABC transporter substrate-binding protein [Nordella sp. HKS 07]
MPLRTNVLTRRAFSLLALSAAAWGSASLPSAAAPTEVRITHSMTGGAQKEVFDAIVAAFEAAHPDIKIKQIVYDDDLYSDTGLITQLKSSSPPEIYFQWAGAPIQRDAREGFAMDLSEALGTDGWKDSFIAPAFSQQMGVLSDGKPYLVPITLDVTNVIWYNKQIFKDAGVTPPANWAELIDLTKKLAGANQTPFVIGNQELWPLGNWASHIASRVVPPGDYEAAFRLEKPFNTPDFEKALMLIDEIRQAGGFNKDIAGLGADPAMSTFFQGAAAMHPIGSWLVSSAAELAEKDFDYDEFNTPLIDPAHPLKDSVIGTLTGFAVSPKSQNPQQAITFLRFFTSPENQVKWAEAGSFSPVKGAMEKAKLDPKTKAMADLLNSASSLVPPPDTTYPVEVAEAYYQAAAYVAGGEKSPKDALVWLDDRVKSMRKP